MRAGNRSSSGGDRAALWPPLYHIVTKLWGLLKCKAPTTCISFKPHNAPTRAAKCPSQPPYIRKLSFRKKQKNRIQNVYDLLSF